MALVERVSDERHRTTTVLPRADFPATAASIYLNTCSMGVMSVAARDAAAAINDAICEGRFSKEESAPLLPKTRERFARLINGAADEVAIVKNVSEGLNAVACARAPRPGENVVVCLDLEHPNNVYLWLKLAQEGVELRRIPARGNAIDPQAMADAIDGETAIVTVSSVTFTPGFRTQLAPISRAARANDALFLVDAVQSCGVLDHDVVEEGIDALVTSTTKNLLGTAGLGFLYVSRPWIERLTPAYVSRYSVARTKDAHESEIEGDTFRWSPNADRFEVGNFNWPAVAAAHAAMGELAAIGVPAIEDHSCRLAEELRQGFEALGLPVNRPADPWAATHMVTVGERGTGGAYATGDTRLNDLAGALKAEGVRFTIRLGSLRFGFHGFNDESDVDRVLAVTRRVVAG